VPLYFHGNESRRVLSPSSDSTTAMPRHRASPLDGLDRLGADPAETARGGLMSVAIRDSPVDMSLSSHEKQKKKHGGAVSWLPNELQTVGDGGQEQYNVYRLYVGFFLSFFSRFFLAELYYGRTADARHRRSTEIVPKFSLLLACRHCPPPQRLGRTQESSPPAWVRTRPRARCRVKRDSSEELIGLSGCSD